MCVRGFDTYDAIAANTGNPNSRPALNVRFAVWLGDISLDHPMTNAAVIVHRYYRLHVV